ncbi:hypothetical protein B0H11DRAFT_1702158, partial [Mycena galericulata]
PQPADNLPVEYRVHGVRIGDVDIITQQGAFHVVFNVCLPTTDPINFPWLFEPLRGLGRTAVAFPPGDYTSISSIRKNLKGNSGSLHSAGYAKLPKVQNSEFEVRVL